MAGSNSLLASWPILSCVIMEIKPLFFGTYLHVPNSGLTLYSISSRYVDRRNVLSTLFDKTWTLSVIKWRLCCRSNKPDNRPTQSCIRRPTFEWRPCQPSPMCTAQCAWGSASRGPSATAEVFVESGHSMPGIGGSTYDWRTTECNP